MKEKRVCGACSECCVILEDDDRPAFTPCRNLRTEGRGCEHYDRRPRTCQLFCCTWLSGHTRPADRPDISGVLAHITLNRYAEEIALNVVECRPDAFAQQRELVDSYKAADVCCVMFVYHDGRRSIYSKDQRFINILREGNACLAGIPRDVKVLEAMLAPDSICSSSASDVGSPIVTTPVRKRGKQRATARPR